MPMQGFKRDWFSAGGKTREIYIAGTGPGVVVIHEIPGITPQVAEFGRRVGVIGMCATGGFALSLMVDPCVMAPVLSQPSLPLPVTAGHRAALGISPAELAEVKARCGQGVTVLGLRFTGDRLCPPERFATLRRELGAGFEGDRDRLIARQPLPDPSPCPLGRDGAPGRSPRAPHASSSRASARNVPGEAAGGCIRPTLTPDR
jgi:hypothetical protein